MPLQVEQGVATQASPHPHDRGGMAPSFAGGPAVAGAGQEPLEHRREQIRPAQPVGGREGLGAEGAPAVSTAEALDHLRRQLAAVASVANPAPPLGATVVTTVASRAEGRDERHRFGRHAHLPPQVPYPPHSSLPNHIYSGARLSGRRQAWAPAYFLSISALQLSTTVVGDAKFARWGVTTRKREPSCAAA